MERRLFSLAIPSFADYSADIKVPSKNFACLLAWDARAASVAEISSLIELLLSAGACYFVCWGPDCERVHDIIDELAVDRDISASTKTCIMTTWHADESLEEAIWFLLVNSQPVELFEESTRASLAISIESPEWESEIGAALDSPREFVRRVSGAA